MARPPLLENVTDRLDGVDKVKVVEYRFGRPGDLDDLGKPLFFADTLSPEWANQPATLRRAEQEKRYDAWRRSVADPPVVERTAVDVRAELADVDQQRRDLMRRRLDLLDELAAMGESIEVPAEPET